MRIVRKAVEMPAWDNGRTPFNRMPNVVAGRRQSSTAHQSRAVEVHEMICFSNFSLLVVCICWA
jgi:hypothetical protein